jgi:hypothetical protein
VAKSPYGASYGGFVFAGQPGFAQCQDLVGALQVYLRDNGVRRFTVTPPMVCCAAAPIDTYAFAMLSGGYLSTGRDLSHVFDLAACSAVADAVSSRVRQNARKAVRHNVEIRRGNLEDFWCVLDKTFAKHGVEPTHSKAEFELLTRLLPDRVYADVAYGGDGAAIAGIGYLVVNARLIFSFYLGQDPERGSEQALTLLLLNALAKAKQAGFLFFDFGTSTVNMQPRENIIRFKEGFSKTAVFRETFTWDDEPTALAR